MFTQLKEILPREINRHGLKNEVEALAVINRFNEQVIALMGEDALDYIKAKVFKNRTLYVDAANSSASQVLFLKQFYILEGINTALNAPAGKKKVEKIIIKTVST